MSKEKDPLLTSSSETEKESDVPPPWYNNAPTFVTWTYDNRERIPGYGVIQLLRKASLYSIYVLIILLLVYLVNQLDRYTISITAKYVGLDLHFGTLDCMPNISLFHEEKLSRSYLIHTMMKDCNKNGSLNTQELCEDYEAVLPNGDESTPICAWDHDGAKGLKYQILAGPVFNNLYPLAGILMGILADRFNRKILLGLSLLVWSLAIGATGFAVSYVMLLIFRMLLALGAAGCNPFALSIIADYFPQELRGSAVGIYYWGIYFGYSLAYAIGNGVNIGLGWRWVFFISALMGIVLVPLVFFTVKEPKRTGAGKDNKPVDGDKGTLNNTKEWSWSRFLSQLREFMLKMRLVIFTFIMPGMLTLCIAGSIRNAGGYVWAYNTQPFFSLKFDDTVIAAYMSVIPLVGGSIGAVVGGLISDLLVKGRGPYARIWVLIISQIIAAPFAAGALFLREPWCFLSLIPSNVFGEMWIGVLSAIILDISPQKIRTTVIAVYLFIITVIGGNFNIIVAPLQKALKKHIDGDDSTKELRSMRWALFLTFPCLYALSSILFVLAFLLMRFDIKWKERKESEAAVSLNRPAKSGSVDSVEEQ